jgi:hypothetical protein
VSAFITMFRNTWASRPHATWRSARHRLPVLFFAAGQCGGALLPTDTERLMETELKLLLAPEHTKAFIRHPLIKRYAQGRAAHQGPDRHLLRHT